MSAPDFLLEFPAAALLFRELQSAFAQVPSLQAHADLLALRGVLHAAAWLDAVPSLARLYAKSASGRMTYHHGTASYDAALMHRTVLLKTPSELTLTGTLVCISLTPGASTDRQQAASSAWQNQLQLMCRFGLDYDVRIRNEATSETGTAESHRTRDAATAKAWSPSRPAAAAPPTSK
ncbi:hypothetical protein MF271_00745 (plasmid) [Deinococcus sp. KNUC1210]|uniref:hypothetical protein n=1 Tax=Deinococcus sp. KNUC1210 TaxID=2917691 RepID=UPI001EF08A31|nr:hypothetical protein [Deinococcus sp. KNUC1210]ULH14040.1 hypothetical protein MF271_00745 [Deinococcus sp. KNUC1210]